MDKRILIGMTFVVVLCVGAWWFVSPGAKSAASLQPAGVSSPELVASQPTKPVPIELTPPIQESDTQRATAAESTSIGASARTTDTALVKVLVVDKSTRAKMPGVKVTLGDTRSGKRTWGEDNGLSRGKPWDTLRTDAEGRAEIEAPARADLIVTVSADRADGGFAMKTVDPLEPGTKTELVLEISSGFDLLYWMKLVDETTRAPLIGATVSAKDKSDVEQEHTSDAQGFVFVPARSWEHTLLHAQAPAHADLYLMPERGHERTEDAFVVELPSSATLHVHVVDGDRANVVEARVVLTTPGHHISASDSSSMSFHHLSESQLVSLTDASGIATFTGLPPRVPIKAKIESPTEWTSAQDLVFEPAEVRDVEWNLTRGCQVHGILLDQTNAPVVAREMWLRKAEQKIPTYLAMYSSGEIRRTVTDRQGRFRFGTVSLGAWWVGPAPVERGKPAAADDVAALAQVVEVVDGQDDVDLTLRVDRGLCITGRVLDTKGGSPRFVSLSAYDERNRLYTFGESRDAAGVYVIGPLMAGHYVLKAHASGHDAESLPVEVDAGARDVVLQLRPGAFLAGTVVDENGKPVPAAVCASRRDSKLGWRGTSPRPGGIFQFQGLEPGTYQVSAHTNDGQIGIVENVEASTTEENAHTVVHLRPGGRVRARHEGPEKYCSITLLQNGIELENDGLARGETKDIVAPVGTVVVRADFYEAKRTVERTVDVRMGETVHVVFEKDAH